MSADGLQPEAMPAAIARSLGPYLRRALELEQFKPIVSYYCKFYITDYIIGHRLHLADADVATFTAALLDNMEQCKDKLSGDDIALMADPAASYSHVEQFALSVFHKGYLEIVNHTATRATISVLKNAVEFMTILKYWGEPLNDTVAKNIKYAKFHIGRIVKAYRSGQDPNDYLTPEDKDIEKNLDSELSAVSGAAAAPAAAPQLQDDLPKPPSAIGSPVDAFPAPPTFIDNDSSSELPQPPSFINDLGAGSGTDAAVPSPPASPAISPAVSPARSPSPEVVHPQPKKVPPKSPQPQNPPKHHMTKQDISEMLSREEKISKTQKYCKFAISALNYDDIDTAVAELKRALALLESESGA